LHPPLSFVIVLGSIAAAGGIGRVGFEMGIGSKEERRNGEKRKSKENKVRE